MLVGKHTLKGEVDFTNLDERGLMQIEFQVTYSSYNERTYKGRINARLNKIQGCLGYMYEFSETNQ